MILNLLIIAFLVAMIVIWSQYGLFSALLHLGVTIVAGALALAIWEPLAYWLLGTASVATHVAWGVSLVLPFGLLIAGLRLLTDRLVKANVNLPDLFNKIGGAVVGLVSGILASGLTVIGLGFLPLPAAIAGYQPLAINVHGGVTQNSSLWVGVDRMAAGFYSGLSTGAFSSASPLATHQPDLVRQSALFRTRPDPNSSTVAVPGSVKVEKMFIHPTLIDGLPKPIAKSLGKKFNQKTNKLVVVQTRWLQNKPGTFDSSGHLRVAPMQVRLVTVDMSGKAKEAKRAQLVAPVAFRGKEQSGLGQTYFYPIDSDESVAYGFNQKEPITFAFIVEQDRVPRFLLARHLRLPLPRKAVEQAKPLIAALGKPAPEPKQTNNGEGGEQGNANQGVAMGGRNGIKVGSEGERMAVTDRLPDSINKNQATSLTYRDSDIVSGRATVEPGSGHGSRSRVEKIANASDKAMVRVRVSGDRAQSLFGAARASAAQINPVFITDNRGNQIRPFGYDWVQDRVQHINVKDFGFFESGKAIEAIPNMQNKDQLYLYFRVNPGVTITSYKMGSASAQSVNLKVPEK